MPQLRYLVYLVGALPSVTVLINSTIKYQLGTQQQSSTSERAGNNRSLGLGISGEITREQTQNESKQTVLHYTCS